MWNLGHQLSVVWSFRASGLFVTLCITSAEAATLAGDDLATLRELGMTDAMLDQVRAMAREPGHVFELDFEAQTVTRYRGA